MRTVRRLLRGEQGQMTVELAVLIPPAIVVALIAYNLMGFVDACAAFDRLSLDAVVAHGVAPSGAQTEATGASEVQSAITSALGREGTCEVSVSVEDVDSGEASSEFVVSPLLRRFVCKLTYKPWPSSVRMPGITLDAPFALEHERSLVVDRYRPGVVV
jgi:Flp pilus assembly pilin Flp